MDRKQRVALEKQRMVEIYRSCRLCGAGGGYKMPIIQQILPSDIDAETELKEKIRECVSIAVSKDDKMPPLICELCVDKVNDFYEFREMCLQINMRTRTKLGLPPQAMPSGSGDASDCILGLTSQVYVNPKEEEDEKITPSSKVKQSIPKITIKKEEKGWNKSMEGESPSTRSSRHSKTEVVNKPGPKSSKALTRSKVREPTPPPPPKEKKLAVLRNSRSKFFTPSPPQEKSSKRILEKSIEREPINKKKLRIKAPSPSPPPTRSEKRRSVTFSPVSSHVTSKRLKQATPNKKPEKLPEKKPEKRSDKTIEKHFQKAIERRPQRATEKKPDKRLEMATEKRPEKVTEKRAVLPTCDLCGQTYSTKKGDYTSHLISSHSPSFTLERLSCVSCSEWFTSVEDALTHHKWHRSAGVSYKCAKCKGDHKTMAAFNRHFLLGQCIEENVVPDVRCDECWNNFATENWMKLHKCAGVDGRPGGECSKCKKKFVRYKKKIEHEATCTGKGKKRVSGVNPNNPHPDEIQPIQVRMERCDDLLQSIKMEPQDGVGADTYDVSEVNPEFGYDKNCIYPYISSVGTIRIKTEDGYITDSMKQEIMDEMYESYDDGDFGDYSSGDELVSSNIVINPFAIRDMKGVEKLSSISLRAVFSEKFLAYGNPPKRKRRKTVKKIEEKGEEESPFDSLFETDDKSLEKDSSQSDADEKKQPDSALDQTDVPASATDQTVIPEIAVDETDALESTMDKTDAREYIIDKPEALECNFDETNASRSATGDAVVPESDLDKTEDPENNTKETQVLESVADKTEIPESATDKTEVTESTTNKTGVPQRAEDKVDCSIDSTKDFEGKESNTNIEAATKTASDETESIGDEYFESQFEKDNTNKLLNAENNSKDLEKNEIDKARDINDGTIDDSNDVTENNFDIIMEKKSDNVDSVKENLLHVTNEQKKTDEIGEEIDRFLQGDSESKIDENDSSEEDYKDAPCNTYENINKDSLVVENVSDKGVTSDESEVMETDNTETNIKESKFAEDDLENELLSGNKAVLDADVEFDVDAVFRGDLGSTAFNSAKLSSRRDSKQVEISISAQGNDIVKKKNIAVSSDKFKDSCSENFITMNNLSNIVIEPEREVQTKDVTSEIVEDTLLGTSGGNMEHLPNVIDENSMGMSDKSESHEISEDSNEIQNEKVVSKFEDETEIDSKEKLETLSIFDESDFIESNNLNLRESLKNMDDVSDDACDVSETNVSDKNEISDNVEVKKNAENFEENIDSNLDYDEASLLKSPERNDTPISVENDTSESKDNLLVGKNGKRIDEQEDVLELDNVSDDDFDFD